MDTGEQFRVPIEMLKEKTMQIRKNSRESAMKKRELNTRYRPMTFIPYQHGMTYDNRRKMPLKIGDMLLIDDSERKNNLKPFFEIIKHVGYDLGIDWGNNMVATKRLNYCLPLNSIFYSAIGAINILIKLGIEIQSWFGLV